MSTLTIDTAEFPNLAGQQVGRELELELTAVVTEVVDAEGGSPSLGVTLTVLRIDIAQTT